MGRTTRAHAARMGAVLQAASRVGEQYQATELPPLAGGPPEVDAEAEDPRVGRTLWSPEGAAALSDAEIAKYLSTAHALPAPGAPLGRAAGSPRLRAAARLEPEPEPRSAAIPAASAAGLSVDTEPDSAAAVAEAIARALPTQPVPLAQEEVLSALHAADYNPKGALAGLAGDVPSEAAGAAALDFSGPKRCARAPAAVSHARASRLNCCFPRSL